MSERCQANDDFKQCRATANLTYVSVRVPLDLELVKAGYVKVALCPKHFVMTEAGTQ